MATPIRGWKGKAIKGGPLFSFVIASYLLEEPRRWHTLLSLLHGCAAQTWPRWEAIIVHDGPLPAEQGWLPDYPERYLRRLFGKQVRLLTTSERKNDHGHSWRLDGARYAQGTYLTFANDDSYYAPVWCEWCLHHLTQGIDFVYGDFIHSHQQWSLFRSKPQKSKIDVGSWAARRDLVLETPWRDKGFSGDGTYVEDLLTRCRHVKKLPAVLFVHN